MPTVDIVKKIEILRSELHRVGIEKGFQNPEVLRLSQALDNLINLYYRSTYYQAEKIAG